MDGACSDLLIDLKNCLRIWSLQGSSEVRLEMSTSEFRPQLRRFCFSLTALHVYIAAELTTQPRLYWSLNLSESSIRILTLSLDGVDFITLLMCFHKYLYVPVSFLLLWFHFPKDLSVYPCCNLGILQLGRSGVVWHGVTASGPLQRDSLSLVWTLGAEVKASLLRDRAVWHDGKEGPNLSWQTHLSLDVILAPRFYTVQCRLEEWTTLYWHQAADKPMLEVKDCRDHWFFYSGKNARSQPALPPSGPGMLMDF